MSAGWTSTHASTHWVSTVDDANRSGDGYVARLTAAGDLDYVVTMGSTAGREDANSIAVDAAGNAYVTGQFSNTMTIAPATGSSTQLASAGNSDLFVLQLNPTGGLVWARRIGAGGFDGGQSIVLGTDGLYLTGYFNGTVDFDPNAGVQNVTGAGGFTDVFILKLNTDSGFANVWNVGGSDYEYSNDIAVNNQGDVGIVGRFQGSGDFEPGPGVVTLTSAGDNDAFVSLLSQGVANRPPVAANGTLATDEDTPATGTLQASDPDGNALTYSLVDTSGSHGTVTITNLATGAYLYTPDANYNGSASFTFQASDGSLTSNVATITITVNPVNDPPSAQDGSFTVDEDTLLHGQVSATDVDGDPLTYSVASGNRPAHAAAFAMQANGTFAYLSSLNYNGSDQFTYTVSDGNGGTATATVTITINPVNDAPYVAFDPPQAETTPEDTPLNGQIQYFDVEGDAVTIMLKSGPANGQVTVNTDGSFVYTPNLNFNGVDTFLITATDALGASRDGAVAVTVTPVNDPPVANDDTYTVAEDNTLTLSATPGSQFYLVSKPGLGGGGPDVGIHPRHRHLCRQHFWQQRRARECGQLQLATQFPGGRHRAAGRRPVRPGAPLRHRHQSGAGRLRRRPR